MSKNISPLSLLPREFPSSTPAFLLIVRLVVGFGFVQHGFAKLMNGPDKFAANLAGLGVPLPHIMSWVTIVAEVACGAAVLTGLLIPFVLIPMAVILLVAMIYVHLQFGFSSIKLQAVTPDGIKFGPPGYEVILLYLCSLASLAVMGAGPFALDSWIWKNWRSQPPQPVKTPGK